MAEEADPAEMEVGVEYSPATLGDLVTNRALLFYCVKQTVFLYVLSLFMGVLPPFERTSSGPHLEHLNPFNQYVRVDARAPLEEWSALHSLQLGEASFRNEEPEFATIAAADPDSPELPCEQSAVPVEQVSSEGTEPGADQEYTTMMTCTVFSIDVLDSSEYMVDLEEDAPQNRSTQEQLPPTSDSQPSPLPSPEASP